MIRQPVLATNNRHTSKRKEAKVIFNGEIL